MWVLLRPTRESESAVRWDVRFFVPTPSSEPGAVSPAGWGKRRDESSKAKAPGYRPSPDHFKTVKRMLAPHGHNYCPQSENSIVWVYPSVFVLDCYCLAIQFCTCPVRSWSRLCVQEKLSFSTLLTRKGTTDDSGKRSAEPFQFAPLSFFPAPPPLRVPFTFLSSPLFRIFPTIWESGTG